MIARSTLIVVLSVSAAAFTGCRLSDSPPWSNARPTAINPYGNRLARQHRAPGSDPFLQNGAAHYTAHPNMSQDPNGGYVHIPSAGHPVPNTPQPMQRMPNQMTPGMTQHNAGGSVTHAAYQTPGANPFQHQMQPQHPQRQRTFVPPQTTWQQHQPQHQPQAQAQPFVEAQAH